MKVYNREVYLSYIIVHLSLIRRRKMLENDIFSTAFAQNRRDLPIIAIMESFYFKFYKKLYNQHCI